MLQSVGVTAIPDLSTSMFVWTGGIGILDFWDHREVVVKCDQEQSVKSLAELFRKQRRPRSRMVENTHCDKKELARTRRSDPIERRGASVDAKSLLTPWLMRKRVWSSTVFATDDAGLSDFKRQCGKVHVDESLNKAICCRVSVRVQPEMESRWKADGVFMGKLDLSDEVIGVGQMRIADEIVCYTSAISDCVKEPNSLMTLTLFNKTDQCSMFKDQIVFNPMISACGKGMSWTMMLYLLCQMQDTELRKNVCYCNVEITTMGKASRWNTALKLLKEAKEHDGDVSNTIMDNTRRPISSRSS